MSSVLFVSSLTLSHSCQQPCCGIPLTWHDFCKGTTYFTSTKYNGLLTLYRKVSCYFVWNKFSLPHRNSKGNVRPCHTHHLCHTFHCIVPPEWYHDQRYPIVDTKRFFLFISLFYVLSCVSINKLPPQ